MNMAVSRVDGAPARSWLVSKELGMCLAPQGSSRPGRRPAGDLSPYAAAGRCLAWRVRIARSRWCRRAQAQGSSSR